jgi:hypothetical protein
MHDKTIAQQTKATVKISSSTQITRKSLFPKIKAMRKRFWKLRQDRTMKKVRAATYSIMMSRLVFHWKNNAHE